MNEVAEDSEMDVETSEAKVLPVFPEQVSLNQHKPR